MTNNHPTITKNNMNQHHIPFWRFAMVVMRVNVPERKEPLEENASFIRPSSRFEERTSSPIPMVISFNILTFPIKPSSLSSF